MLRPADTAAALDAYADVRTAVHPDAPLAGEEVRRRAATLGDGRRYFVASAASPSARASRAGRARRAVPLCSSRSLPKTAGVGSALLETSLAHRYRPLPPKLMVRGELV
jgi:hypothetical protein